jgi:hypothetical protein
MELETLNPPLTNVQSELLQLFRTDLPETDLIDLKKNIAHFLLTRARDKADSIWQAKGYNDDTIQSWLNEE